MTGETYGDRYVNPEDSLKAYRDWQNTIATAEYKGVERGRAEGLAEGEKRKALEIARQMKSRGIPADVVAQCTGLDVEDIGRL